jgi:prephenate dehydrogenase
VVDVNDNDETVHVSTPIRAMSSAIEELAAASAAPTR